MIIPEESFSKFLKALKFASVKHKDQKRKGACPPPYINHPIEVMQVLWEHGAVRDTNILMGALLHDTIEDTATSQQEIEQLFGKEVLQIVKEVTNPKYLSRQAVKQKQIDDAPHKSPEAKQLKLADLICNIQDVSKRCPPLHWSINRRLEYLDWANKVATGLKGCNTRLEQMFEQKLQEGRTYLQVSH